ncbi:MAG TPA: AAA family ATPase [Nocardioides sp.]|uniref:bifunctional aminoglycoside phosphotransferase/ATP-binding protein n=1 Tax=Nocardioides sp. TaxID=35761 RepID=UPI002C35DEE6|nr:AAA family ATPase [Nocardioides sp.]HTW13879.1 AAA family ATPase [Nocardioides sp.]
MTGDEPYADLRQTHSGVVMLLGDLAYKVKRPVRLGFLDFSTLEARRAVCAREVELNRRFSPDVYLGVGALRRPDGVEEPAVVMRRMPDARRLAHLVRSDPENPRLLEMVDDVARRIAALHGAAPRSARIDDEGTRDAIASRWDASFAQLHDDGAQLIGRPLLAEIEERVHRFLAGRADLFARRVADGLVVDGHGDLTADDIFCLDDGARFLDCLEFDDRLRYVDVLDDLAFLAMELEWLGAPVLSRHLIERYLELTGDPGPVALRHHLIAYRAFVRAKVSCLQGAAVRATASVQAAGYADLAVRHLRAGEVRIVLVGGPPGTGKTTLAGDVADRLGFVVISSDRVRKELAGVAAETPASADLWSGIYDAEHTAATYQEMLRRAEMLVARGESVVLDASWTDAGQRRAARNSARSTRSRLVALFCQCDSELAAQRVAARAAVGGSISDADERVAAALRAKADPWPHSIVIDTSSTRETCAEIALWAVQESGRHTDSADGNGGRIAIAFDLPGSRGPAGSRHPTAPDDEAPGAGILGVGDHQRTESSRPLRDRSHPDL